MKCELQVRVVNQVESGISKKNGMPWKGQNIIVAWSEPHFDGTPGKTIDQLLAARIVGENVDHFASLNIQPGSLIKADVVFNTRNFGNSVGTEVLLYNIERAQI